MIKFPTSAHVQQNGGRTGRVIRSSVLLGKDNPRYLIRWDDEENSVGWVFERELKEWGGLPYLDWTLKEGDK